MSDFKPYYLRKTGASINALDDGIYLCKKTSSKSIFIANPIYDNKPTGSHGVPFEYKYIAKTYWWLRQEDFIITEACEALKIMYGENYD